MDKKEELINKYLDGRITEEEGKELKKLLEKNGEIEEELNELSNIQEVIDMLETKEPDRRWDEYWSNLYNRIERGLGWIILSIGAILTLTFAGFTMVRDLISDPELALYAKIGIMALILGFVILFVSVLRERIFLSKTDKYSREVKR